MVFVLFCFWENVFFNSYIACYVICSCRKTFKQPFTDVLQIGVPKSFIIFTGKTFLIKFQDWRPAFLFKKRLQRNCFSVNIAKFLRIAFLLKACSLSIINYMMIDNWYFRVIFYYCKIRPRNRKNFAIDRSKFVFRYLIISLLQRFVSSSNCKEKLVVFLVSSFAKYI